MQVAQNSIYHIYFDKAQQATVHHAVSTTVLPAVHCLNQPYIVHLLAVVHLILHLALQRSQVC
jgi:hypothetical protein